MKRLQAVTGVIGAFFLVSQPAQAAETWRVSKIFGHAWIVSSQSERSELAVGAEVPAGATLFTGAQARVMIVRGAENILVGPKSILAVSSEPTPGLQTTVIERVGTARFDVDKQNVQHFSVETPLLAAVVKGTSFSVNVSRGNANVAVARGAVEVTSLATGEAATIAPGQKAAVNAHRRGGRLGLSGGGAMPSIVHGLPRRPLVAPLSSAISFSSPANAISAAQAAAGSPTGSPTAGGASAGGVQRAYATTGTASQGSSAGSGAAQGSTGGSTGSGANKNGQGSSKASGSGAGDSGNSSGSGNGSGSGNSSGSGNGSGSGNSSGWGNGHGWGWGWRWGWGFGWGNAASLNSKSANVGSVSQSVAVGNGKIKSKGKSSKNGKGGH